MRYKNVIFPDSAGFHCKNCGICCRDQPPDISLKEQQRIETEGFRDFLQAPNDPHNRSLRTNKDGSCIFLTMENTCKIQKVKPSICVLEPFVITDFDINTKTIYVDYNPAAAKTCRGIEGKENAALDTFGEAALAIVEEMMEIVAVNMGLPVTDEKVGLRVKKLLRH
jgi:Fe-S-cluster containining protein